MAAQRIQVEVAMLSKEEDGSWRVDLKSLSTKRNLFMKTTRQGYCAGQLLQLTYESVSQEGEVVGARFKGWLPFLFSRKPTLEEKLSSLTDLFQNFRHKNHYKKTSGKILVEGGYQVGVDKRGWFLLYQKGSSKKLMSFCHPQGLAKWLVEAGERNS